jgi:hypothetical protein
MLYHFGEEFSRHGTCQFEIVGIDRMRNPSQLPTGKRLAPFESFPGIADAAARAKNVDTLADVETSF